MNNRFISWIVRLIRMIVPYSSRVFRGLYFVYIRLTSKARLKRKNPADMSIQIHMADHCNLRCKGCNAFAPLIEECFADIAVIKNDLARFAELTGGAIGSLTISGGEPLLHPRLPEVLEYARKCFPGQKLQIITNGILLEKAREEFWAGCRDNDVTISFTHYPIEVNIEKIKELALSHNVRFVYQDDTDVREKTMSFTPLDPSGKQDMLDSFKLCYMSNDSFVLENGRIYTCPIIAHIEHFNKFFNQNFVVSEYDYSDIYKVENIDEILDLLCKPVPFCRYCNKRNRVSGLNWEESRKEISEWI